MTTTEQRSQIERQLREGKVGIVPRLQRVEVRDVDDKGRRLFGRAVPYDLEIDLGWYIESMAPGVFAKSIKESARELPLLLFHDSGNLETIVGKAESWEDGKTRIDGFLGLDGVWKFDRSEEARRAADKAEDGSLGFMSVQFIPKSGEAGSVFSWDDDDVLHVRRIEARLLETSLTPTPAYNAAAVSKVRSRPQFGTPRLDRWRSWLDAARV